MLGHKHDHWNITRIGEIETPRRLDSNIVGVKSLPLYWSAIQAPEFLLDLINGSRHFASPYSISDYSHLPQFMTVNLINCLRKKTLNTGNFAPVSHLISGQNLYDCACWFCLPSHDKWCTPRHGMTQANDTVVTIGPGIHRWTLDLISYHLSHNGRKQCSLFVLLNLIFLRTEKLNSRLNQIILIISSSHNKRTMKSEQNISLHKSW